MNTTLEEDLEKLKEENLTYTHRFGLVYRIEKKKILRSQIDLAQFIISLLEKFKENKLINFKEEYMKKTLLE